MSIPSNNRVRRVVFRRGAKKQTQPNGCGEVLQMQGSTKNKENHLSTDRARRVVLRRGATKQTPPNGCIEGGRDERSTRKGAGAYLSYVTAPS